MSTIDESPDDPVYDSAVAILEDRREKRAIEARLSQFDRTSADGLRPTSRNLELILEAGYGYEGTELAGIVIRNALNGRITCGRHLPWRSNSYLTAWSERDDFLALRAYLHEKIPGCPEFMLGKVKEAVNLMASRHIVNPLTDWLTGLEWNGTPRLDNWLFYLLGAEDTLYHSAVGRKFLIGAVARAFAPGCKMDTMLILQGAQGIGKSSFVKAMFSVLGDAFPVLKEGMPLIDSGKGAAEAIQGFWCIEAGEMSGFKSKELNEIKGFISRTEDTYARKYENDVTVLPRRCVFVGTSNNHDVVHDTTGNRRVWPVAVSAICLL
jgi:putative DNA primase/helicase